MRKLPLLAVLLTLVFALLGRGAAQQNVTPAGTVITNTATATYYLDNTLTNQRQETSNTVRTVIAPVCAISVGPNGSMQSPGQVVEGVRAEAAVFRYTITNTGNDTFNVPIWVEPIPGSSYVPLPEHILFYREAAPFDGQVGLNDTRVTTNFITLGPGETASLLMVVTYPRGTTGDAYLTLVASCAVTPGAPQDRDNVVLLTLPYREANLSVQKQFDRSEVEPGGTVGVTFTFTNTGDAPAVVSVLDLLNTAALEGLSYVPGSFASGGDLVEYSTDGVTWSTVPPANVAGLRFRVTVPAGGTVTVRFAMKADPTAKPGKRTNVADASSLGRVTRVSASVMIGSRPALYLGPVDRPRAREMTEEDTQTHDGSVLGMPVCFTHTLENGGNTEDNVSVGAVVEAGQADVAFFNLDGTPLEFPVKLAPGQTFSFRVCITPRAVGKVRVVLTASGTSGAPVNRTVDELTGIEDKPLPLTKTVDPVGVVRRGADLTYTLTVTNPYAFPLVNVVVTDALDANLDFVSASDGGTLQNGAVSWTIPTLAPGETRTLTVKARVKAAAPDDIFVKNCFTVAGDQLREPVQSPCVTTPVWSAELRVTKTASAAQVTIGDRLGYTLTATNTSTNATLVGVEVRDTLPAGLRYVPGSSKIDGRPVADPALVDGTLVWTVPSLGPGVTVTITFDVRVLPEAPQNLVNTVLARGTAGVIGTVVQVTSNVASARTQITAGLFAPRFDIVGLVYVDRNRDGVYQEGVDTPLPRARVILSAGRTVLTDEAGRYHFANVDGGFSALRLDPNSVPYPPLRVPQDGGLPGTRSLLVSGLTSVDFPLQPLGGDIGVTRDARLTMGPLGLVKTVGLDDEGVYTVRIVLNLNGAAALPGFVLDDPLPGGATLLSGQNVLRIDLAGGETVVTYRFRLARPTTNVVTDPKVTWRPQ